MTDKRNTQQHTANLRAPDRAQESDGSLLERPPSPQTTHLSDKWRLLFKIGEQSKRLTLVTTPLIVGRKLEADNSASSGPSVGFDLTPYGAYHFGVSRRHALLTLQDTFLYIEDLSSTNGTRINGFQLTPRQKYRLRDGDEIEFARLRVTLRFERPGAT